MLSVCRETVNINVTKICHKEKTFKANWLKSKLELFLYHLKRGIQFILSITDDKLKDFIHQFD